MLTDFTKKVKILALVLLFCNAVNAQIRPYTQVYSQNLKGSIAIFGNTSMHIVDVFPSTLKMNETSDPLNGVGGVGFSQYGNDNENMQPVNIDGGPIPQLNVFNSVTTWSYNSPATDQGTTWRSLSTPPPATWATGTASFGYSGDGLTTTIPKSITNYFLKNVTITNPSLYSYFTCTYSYDDGAVIYVNGVEVKRSNMPSGVISFSTQATSSNSTSGETFIIPSSAFVAGNNVIAVEVHQNAANSNDFLFNMSLVGNAPPYTGPSNSSSANLVLPIGTNTIKFARLYWGGRIDGSLLLNSPDTLRKIKIRKGSSGAYSNALAAASSVDQFALTSSTEIVYQSYIDITSFIQLNGAGTYTIADVPCLSGAISGGGRYGGWCIQIAYENTNLPFTSVRLYDGFSRVFSGGNISTITLNGLNVPGSTISLSDAIMHTMVWEGDANLGGSVANPAGDYIKVNGVAVSNLVNPTSNFWNGSISKNGSYVTTKNPNYSNQMGIDIDEIEVGTGFGILPNATTVNIEFGTEADQYFPSVFGFAIKMKTPLITLLKTVTDANSNNALDPNEELTYTLSGANSGLGNGYNTFVVDSLPTNVTYVLNSLKIVNAPGVVGSVFPTDGMGDDLGFKSNVGSRNYVKFFIGNGATPTSGGEVPIGTSFSLQFKVRVPAIPGSVINTARVTTTSLSNELFTDDGTVIIGPQGGPLAVKLISFSGILKNQNTYLTWITENELNNDHFDVERSEDGVTFKKIGTVKGNGTTTSINNYDFVDGNLPQSNIVYYRLRTVEFDGTISISGIIFIRLKGSGNWSVFPNPFENNIRITMNALKDEIAVCRIISLEGKELINRKINLLKGNNLVVLNDLEQIASGSYLLQINTATEKFTQKIIRK